MKFKLDENFGTRTIGLFHKAGYEAYSVREQGLSGYSDSKLFRTCRDEQLSLVTLDLDFSDVTRFPPIKSSGVVIIRIPVNPSRLLLERLVHQFLQAVAGKSLNKQLWVVEIGRIRIHQSETEDE